MKLYELYQEGKSSTVTHDGKKYNIDNLLRKAKDVEVENFNVDDLKWIIKDTKIDEDRVKKANTRYPILVTRWKNKIVVLDGLHRLAKSIKHKKEKIKGKMISAKMLKSALID